MTGTVLFAIALAVIMLIGLLVSRCVVLKIMKNARENGERPLVERDEPTDRNPWEARR